ncbi:cation:proton antiporter [Candidatus Poribacteria bacterium]|nr:cation:proton antiporter [Candidatus Poribacteria bacterium]
MAVPGVHAGAGRWTVFILPVENRMTPHDVTAFLVAVAMLLGFARLLGEVARHFRQPAVLGEILAGIILGPTILGRFAPEWQQALFPMGGPTGVALDAIFLLAVTLFLLVAGMEVDLSTAFRLGRSALIISVFGLAFPFALGFVVAWAAPGLLMEVQPGNELVFALFFATALSISALPVIAKILKDLNLIKTDLGVIVVAAAIINDLAGWIIFAIILGMMGVGNGSSVGTTILLTLAFAGGMLTLGRLIVHRMLPWLQAHTSWPGGVLGFALSLGLFCAALTERIGIHAIFGAFIFGVALGDSRHMRQRTRETLDQFISFIFAPLFFASIGLQVDFIAGFQPLTVVLVLVVAFAGKILGCAWAGRLAGLPKQEFWAIGLAMNARGAMEIILGLLALQYGVIEDPLFVALVVMALVTSMTSGLLMERVLKRKKPLHFQDLLSGKTCRIPLKADTRKGAILELSASAARATRLPPEDIARAVLERENLSPTGLPNSIAIPHARLDALPAPLIAIGLNEEGIDFDAPDGSRAKLVFLILTPSSDNGAQLQILAGIARAAQKSHFATEAARCGSFTELLAYLRGATHVDG